MGYEKGNIKSDHTNTRTKETTLVRIMGVSIKAVDDCGLLVVSEIEIPNYYMKKIRIYLHESMWNMKGLSIANQYYLQLVKYRELLRKKVKDKHLYKTYQDVALLERNETTHFYGIKQLYRAELKNPNLVLSKPRANYKEVKSDTLRLWLRDEILKTETTLTSEKIKKGE